MRTDLMGYRVIDPVGRRSETLYDAEGQVLSEHRAVGTALAQIYATRTWTPNGQLATVIDANDNLSGLAYEILEHEGPGHAGALLQDIANGVVSPQGASDGAAIDAENRFRQRQGIGFRRVGHGGTIAPRNPAALDPP